MSSNPFEDAVGADGKEKVIESRLEVVPPSVIESMSRAEIDVAIATAKRWPRDLDRALKSTQALACKNEEIAATCTFAVPRGGKTIIGPSIHFARIMMINWGNVNALARVVDANHEDARLQGVCHDLENNLRFGLEIEWPVQAPHADKDGNIRETRWKDQMNIAKAAGSAVALRRAVFGCIPFALFRNIWKETQLVAAGKGKSFDDRRKNMFQAFAELKVSDKEICEFLGRAGKESVSVEDLVAMFGILTAIGDNATTVEEVFGPRGPETQKARIPKSKAQAPTEPKAEPPQDEQQQSPPVSTHPAQAPKEEQERHPEGARAEPAPKIEEPPPVAKTPAAVAKPTNGLLSKLREKLASAGVAEEKLLAYLHKDDVNLVGPEVKTLEEVPEKFLRMVLDYWQGLIEEIKA
jgi:hypothetical protein